MYSRLQGAKVFSTLDLRSGYCHINFIGKFQKPKLPLLLCLVNISFEAVPFSLWQYLDDIIIFSHILGGAT